MESSPMKLKPVSLSDQVLEYIKTYIRENQLKPGDKLPSEGWLSKNLGVNRLTVRLALQQLVTLGVIETRFGEGSFIREFSLMPLLENLYDVYFTSTNTEEIFKLRRMMELESTKEILTRCSDEEIRSLEPVLKDYIESLIVFLESPTESNREYMIERDLDFHYALCELSGNSLFRDLFALMRPLMCRSISAICARRYEKEFAEELLRSGIWEHEAHAVFYRAIVSRDWKACKTLYASMTGSDEQAYS